MSAARIATFLPSSFRAIGRPSLVLVLPRPRRRETSRDHDGAALAEHDPDDRPALHLQVLLDLVDCVQDARRGQDLPALALAAGHASRPEAAPRAASTVLLAAQKGRQVGDASV